MAILTYEELKSALIVVREGSPFYSQFLTDAFFVMYYSGCRPIELLDRSRWRFDANNVLFLQPAKGNSERIIPGQLWPTSFDGWVRGEDSSFRLVTYYSCRNLFNHLFPIKQTFIGNKAADQYLFRHRFVKDLKIQGRTDQQIMTDMGWSSPSLVNRYVNSVIYN